MACAIMFLGVFVPLLQFFPMLRTDGDGSVAALPIALDIVFLNARVNQFNGLQRLLPEPLGLFQANLFFDFFHAAGKVADDLSTASA